MLNINASPTVESCKFVQNSATAGGGGMFNWTSTPSVSNSEFRQNQGGGMMNYDSIATVSGCEFIENMGVDGGAISNTESSSLVLTDSSFESNFAGEGGAIDIEENCDATITNCEFLRNGGMYTSEGGALFIRDRGTARISNSIFIANSAWGYGGAIYVVSETSVSDFALKVLGCTFTQNTAGSSGGGIAGGGERVFVANSILWQNIDENGTGEASQIANVRARLRFCDIQGGWTGVPGIGILNANPLFVTNPDPGIDGTWDGVDDNFGDLRLQFGSPCIDAGDNSAIPAGITTDLDGNPRVYIALTDMGAYEHQDCNGNEIPDNTETDTDSDGAIDDCDNCLPSPIPTFRISMPMAKAMPATRIWTATEN
jgi:predicted outer membrane repeat protein